MPGGKIPNQGNPPAAKGVGRNSKRHDLERPSTPGLANSDLQSGDVGMLEQGQRVAPIQTQGRAIPAPTGGSTPARTSIPNAQPGTQDIINARLGNTLGPSSNVRPGDPKMLDHQRKWAGFLQQISRQPQASPLLRARAGIAIQSVREASSRPSSSLIDLGEADDAIEGFLGGF